jgi:hypothetical protein
MIFLQLCRQVSEQSSASLEAGQLSMPVTQCHLPFPLQGPPIRHKNYEPVFISWSAYLQLWQHVV